MASIDVTGPSVERVRGDPDPDCARRSSPTCSAGSARRRDELLGRAARAAPARSARPARSTSSPRPQTSATATGRSRRPPADLQDRRVEITGPTDAQDGDQRAQLRRPGLAGRPRGRQHAALGERRSSGQVTLYDAVPPHHRVHLARGQAVRAERRRPGPGDRAAAAGLALRREARARRRHAGGRRAGRLRACYFFHNAAELLARGTRPVLLPAEDGVPPRGPALERRLHPRPGGARTSRTARSARRC